MRYESKIKKTEIKKTDTGKVDTLPNVNKIIGEKTPGASTDSAVAHEWPQLGGPDEDHARRRQQ